MSYKVEHVTPYKGEDRKKEQVEKMFNEIAPKYDKLNGALSLGIDNYWRSDAIRELRRYNPKHILDIATGTGDFALLAEKIIKPEKITAVDISEGMMVVGKKKVSKKRLSNVISFDQQDCAALTYPDNSFDAVTISFGVRNFESIDQSFQEILRVLRPGGIFLFLELTTPEKEPIKRLYNAYTKFIMPFLSDLLHTERKAYEYLPESIAAFPQGREMMLILKKNGFRNIRLRRYTLGVTTVYMAEK